MLNSQQQTKLLVTSLFADLLFSILTTLIFKFSFSLPFHEKYVLNELAHTEVNIQFLHF